MINKSFWQAVAALVGYTIGAGILGVPYVVGKVGLLPGLGILILLGLALMLINLMIAEIMSRTHSNHQLVGLIDKYLGRRAKFVQSFAMIIGSYGALTAYLIGEGQVLAAIFNQPPEKQVFFTLIFLVCSIFILIVGLRLIKVVESWLVLLLVIVAVIISGWSMFFSDFSNFSHIDLSKAFVPYGVLLFAFGGTGAIFTVKEILRHQVKKIKPAIITSGVIVMAIYAIFAVAVIGVTGMQTSEIATVGLGERLGENMILVGNIFAMLTMATSFLTVALSLHQVFRYDYRIKSGISWFLVLLMPIIIFFYVSRDFIQVISVVGSLTFGISGILIVWSYWKSKQNGDQKPVFLLPKLRILGIILMLMFSLGIIYTIFGSNLFS